MSPERPAREAMVPRKAICSIGSGPHAELLALSRPTFAAYAERHGYELITTDVAPADRPPAWAKVPLVRELLGSFDVVVWLDADALVVDPDADIAAELQPGNHFGLVQHRLNGALRPNTGVMVLRAGPRASALLEHVWRARRYIRHPWWENAAVVDALGYDLPASLRPGVAGRVHRLAARLPGRSAEPGGPARPSPFLQGTQFLSNEWNSIFGDMAERPRIVHCLGTPLEQRRRDMATVLQSMTGTG